MRGIWRGLCWCLGLGAALSVGSRAFEPPVELIVLNAASRWPLRMGAGGAAPGSRIAIEADGLALASGAVAITLRAGGKVTHLEPLAVQANTLETRLPADLTAGVHELYVRTAAGEERTAKLPVVPVSPGLCSRNGRGYGPARGAVPVAPGATVRLACEGLGRLSKVAVLVGGRRAEAMKSAKNAEGADEITFQVPSGAPEGCYIPVQTEVDGKLSNTVTIAVGRGRCLVRPGQPAPEWFDGPVGVVALVRTALRESPEAPAEVRDEVAAAFFEKSEPAELGPLAWFPPDGECATYARAYDGKELAAETLRTLVVDGVDGESLDAGAALAIHDGRRRIRIPALDGATGFYRRTLAELFFDKPALYVTGGGGAAVGEFAMPAARPEAFEWLGRPTKPGIRASDGLVLRWKDAPPGSTMLAVAAVADPVAGVLATCHCAAPAAAGFIHMRPEHLRHLRAGGGGSPGMLLLIPWPSRAAAIPAEGARRSAAVSLYVQGSYHVFR